MPSRPATLTRAPASSTLRSRMLTLVDGLQHEIAAGVTAGMAIDEIEDRVISPAPLSQDQQAALWLYGWALERLADRGQL
jgi:hypothetical protein